MECRYFFNNISNLSSSLCLVTFLKINLTIRTGYDAASRQHWLSAYRPKYSARFLLSQSKGKHPTTTNSSSNNNNDSSVEDEIRNAVDQMIRVMPPRIDVSSTQKN